MGSPTRKVRAMLAGISALALVGLVVVQYQGIKPGMLLSFHSGFADQYKCAEMFLKNENECVFMSAYGADLVGATELMPDIHVGTSHHRAIVDQQDKQVHLSAVPLMDGDREVETDHVVTGNEWQFVLAFELLAPLRNAIMYDPRTVTDNAAYWGKITKAFKQCHIKEESFGLDYPDPKYQHYSVDGIYELIKDPKKQDIHVQIVKFFDEGALDLLCLMTTNPNLLDPNRCAKISSLNGIKPTQVSDCWIEAYYDLYHHVPRSLFPVHDPRDKGENQEEVVEEEASKEKSSDDHGLGGLTFEEGSSEYH